MMYNSGALPVKIAWNQLTRCPLAASVAEWDRDAWRALVGKAMTPRYPTYRLRENLIVEIPDLAWGHGDLLIYMPAEGWLLRRNYRDRWYVDIGVFKPLQGSLYTWTDLWLDVISPDLRSGYHLLDADEFGTAIRDGAVSPELAAYAMDRLHALVEAIHTGRFPYAPVEEAVAFAADYAAR